MALFTFQDYQDRFPDAIPAAQADGISAVCDGVSAAVEKYVGRPLVRQTHVEYYSPKGDEAIVLNNRPVWAVSEVRFDAAGGFGQKAGTFGAETVLTAGDQYYLDLSRGTPSYSGLLYPNHFFWDRGYARPLGKLAFETRPLPGALKVTYDAGYDPVPDDVLLACCQVVTQVRAMVRLGGSVVFEKLGESMYKRATDELKASPELGSARQILARYRDLPW